MQKKKNHTHTHTHQKVPKFHTKSLTTLSDPLPLLLIHFLKLLIFTLVLFVIHPRRPPLPFSCLSTFEDMRPPYPPKVDNLPDFFWNPSKTPSECPTRFSFRFCHLLPKPIDPVCLENIR